MTDILTKKLEEFDRKFPLEGTLIYDNPFSHPVEIRKELISFLRSFYLSILEDIEREVIGEDMPEDSKPPKKFIKANMIGFNTSGLWRAWIIAQNDLREDQRSRLSAYKKAVDQKEGVWKK